jgi:hypothetical protein
MTRPFVATKQSLLGRCSPRPGLELLHRPCEGPPRRGGVELEVVEAAVVPEHLQEPHEGVLRVGVPHDVPPQEVRQRLEEPRLHPVERLDEAVVGEQPAAEAEGLGVLVLRLPERGAARVDEQRLRVDLADEVRQGERRRHARGTLPEQDAPGGVVPEAVRVREAIVLLQEDAPLQPLQLAAEQVRIGLEDRGERAHFPSFHLPTLITAGPGRDIPPPSGSGSGDAAGV